MRIFGDLTWQMPEKWPIWKKLDARKMGFSDRTFWGIWGGPKLTQRAGAGRQRSNVVLTVDYLYIIILHRRFDYFPMDTLKKISRLPLGFKTGLPAACQVP